MWQVVVIEGWAIQSSLRVELFHSLSVDDGRYGCAR